MYAAIETSFDETGIAVLDAAGETLWCVLSSQVELHEPYGGCVPELAARTHLCDLPQLWRRMPVNVLAGIRFLGVTAGPGLPGCLLAGINFCRGLSKARSLPLYGLNHLCGHIFSPFMPAAFESGASIRFPHLALLVSGGHTELFLIRGYDDHLLLGQTQDDAVGELLDKTAALLGLGYPGGARMEQLAQSSGLLDAEARYSGDIRLPVPMRESGDYNFSYSGLKTAVVRLVRGVGAAGLAKDLHPELAAALFSVMLDSLWLKVGKALRDYNLDLITVSGGVAINNFLRQRFAREASQCGVECLFPAKQHCLDNAEMMAWLMKLYVEQGTMPTQFDVSSNWNPGLRQAAAV